MAFRPRRPSLLAPLLALVVAGCGGDDAGSKASGRSTQLAAVIKGLDNPYFVTLRDGLVATARGQHVRLRVSAAPTGLEDTAGQAAALASVATDKPGCYVVNPINPTNLVSALARVADGTPIVNVDSFIDKRAAKAVGVRVSTYIGTDNRAGGKLGADAMAQLVPPGAKVAVITGIPGDIGSGQRAAGFKQGIGGRFNVVASAAADFERDKAKAAAAELLRSEPGITGFFAVNDLMALGVADAVRSSGKTSRVKVVGFDGIPEALAAVGRGSMSATVAQYPFTMGQLSVEACLAAMRGDRLPAFVDAPVQVVTHANVARARANFPRPVERFDDPFAR